MGVRTGDQGVEADSQTGSQGEGRRKFISCLMGVARMLLSVTSGLCLCEVPRVDGKGFGFDVQTFMFLGSEENHIFSQGRVLILLQFFCLS